LKRNTRNPRSIRKVNCLPGFCPQADGSVLFEMGDTRIICAAYVSDEVPDHAREKGTGWLTAEYTLLPYSTRPRTKRRTSNPDGRAVEIQRLIGRSLRRVVDLGKLAGYSITVDCDVLQADGGTRTASITGGCIAIRLAAEKMVREGLLPISPIAGNVAAISVGYVDGELMLDLDYSEDSAADVDMNIVMDHEFNLVEVQGTGEQASFSRRQLEEMIDLAAQGIGELFEILNRY